MKNGVPVSKRIKRVVAHGLARGPLAYGIGRTSWRQNRLLILCYHGFSLADEHEWNSSLFIPKQLLRRRCELMEKHGCTVLPLAEALQRMDSGDLPPRSVVITVDDGNYDFLAQGQPILNDFGFPATVYMTTYHSLDGRAPFPVAIRYLMWKAGKRGGSYTIEGIAPGPVTVDFASASALQGAFDGVMAHVDGWSAVEKHDLIRSFCDQTDHDFEAFERGRYLQLMSPDEARLAASRGASIEMHTHRHRVPRQRDLFVKEIEENAAIIEGIVGARPKHFCFPKARAFPEVIPWVAELGIESGVVATSALASIRSPRLTLPRITDHNGIADIEFEAWLTGGADFLPKRRRPKRW